MIVNIIKYYTIFYCFLIIYLELSQKNYEKKFCRIFLVTLSLVSTSILISAHSTELAFFISVFLFVIITSSLSLSPLRNFVISLFSFGLSFSFYATVGFLLTLIIYPLFSTLSTFPYIALAILSSLTHIFLVKQLLKIRRFKIGLPYLNTEYGTIIAATTGIIFIVFYLYIFYLRKNPKIQLFAAFFIAFTFTFLIYWWQAQITKTYRRRLELRELESLRAELLELNEVVQQLKDDNERLARISHRDNSLISALRDSTLKYLSTDYENPEDALEVREKLIQNINALSEGRASALPNYEKKTARDFDTGLPLLDELLHHMDGVAIENGIILAVHFSVLLNDFVPAAISEEDLVHTVDDLLKNAYKSTLTHEKRLVQLQFFKLGKHFVVEVADNGIPFEARSLVNMGLEALTTYEDGSGIGLMDIWGTKEKYRATYHLDEYETSTPFSKKISLIFDKKNRFSILTSRKNEILKICNRLDLQVYSRNN